MTTIQAAYITDEDGGSFLNVYVGAAEFHKFPISQLTKLRLASECATSAWSDFTRGMYGAAPNP